jgi:uncharacterized cupredoxin-like copper-binding protein/Cu/Ag efflux protein CusF
MLKLMAAIVGTALLVAFILAYGEGQSSTPFGDPGMAGVADRTIAVTMSDEMRFTPDRIAVRQDETVRFIVRNAGTIRHEMMIGTVEELKQHAKLMQQFPEMEHEDENAVTVDPGQQGEIVWTFSLPGTFAFACLMPGHYEAGMKGEIAVAASSSSRKPSAVIPPVTHDHHMSASLEPASTAGPSGVGHGEGDVRRIDKAAGKITLRHGPLIGLKDADGRDMPGMTMVFRVKEPAVLDRLKVGDKVRFTVMRENGALVVPSIEPAR